MGVVSLAYKNCCHASCWQLDCRVPVDYILGAWKEECYISFCTCRSIRAQCWNGTHRSNQLLASYSCMSVLVIIPILTIGCTLTHANDCLPFFFLDVGVGSVKKKKSHARDNRPFSFLIIPFSSPGPKIWKVKGQLCQSSNSSGSSSSLAVLAIHHVVTNY